MTNTKAAHPFATTALLLLPVLVFLHSVSPSYQIEETAQTLHSPSMASLWHGSPPTATGSALEAGKATAAAPIYELKHGLGVFTIASGTGCYEGAKGQAQARFGVVTADVDLFVPSVLDMLDEEGVGASPQDTVFDMVGGDNDVQRRLDSPVNRTDSHQCDIFHSGKKSFNQISIRMERRSSSAEDGRTVQDSSASYHHHGIFRAKEEWFDGMAGEYSLGCVHHECTMSLFFGIGMSNDCEEGSCGNPYAGGEKGMTSLKLQGTTELAYQGADTNMLVCVENCDGVGGIGGSAVNLDAEYVEPIRVRSFDNNVVQVLSSHTKAPKAAKGAGGTNAPKAAKGAGGTKAPKAAKGAGGTKAPKAGKSAKNNQAALASAATPICTSCSANADCDDGLFCSGVEMCINGCCQAGSGNPCPGTSSCDEASSTCICANAGQCDDGISCTNDACNVVCSNTPVDFSCDDTNACTMDACDPTNGAIGTGCVFTPIDPPTSAQCILMTLYDSTDGANWDDNTGWKTDPSSNPCTWFGVVCSGGVVTAIYLLTENNLVGTIPTELALLTSLTDLRLENQDGLVGTIPTEIGNLDLTLLRLRNTNIGGTIPSELGNIGTLGDVQLRNMDLTGTIPTELASLMNLNAFNVDGNNLSNGIDGAVPDAFCDAMFPGATELWLDNIAGPTRVQTNADCKAALFRCVSDAECDDGLACNGVETCDGVSCQAGTPVSCPTYQTCQEPAGTCEYDCNEVSLVAGQTCYETSALVQCGTIDTLVVVSTAQLRPGGTGGHSEVAGNIGFQLAEPRTDALNDCYKAIIAATGPPALYAFGVNDIASEGTYVFGSDGSAVNFGAYSTSPWYTGEPNNSGGVEDCIVYTVDQLWGDGGCSRNYGGIYELV